MNPRKIEKIEKKLIKRGTRKQNKKERLLQEVREKFKEWLQVTEKEWWKKRSR